MSETVDRDAGFQSWLAMQEFYLDEFLGDDMPAMADPYSPDGLSTAEGIALTRFANKDEATADPEMTTKFIRFIGECFVRRLGGRWTNRPAEDDGQPFIGIAFSWTPNTLAIPTLYTSAFARRSGQQWAKVYRFTAEDKAAAEA